LSGLCGASTGAATAIVTMAAAINPQNADIGERLMKLPSDRPARLQRAGRAGKVDDRANGIGPTRLSGAVAVIADVSSGPAMQ
jgi:hypothetical protein